MLHLGKPNDGKLIVIAMTSGNKLQKTLLPYTSKHV